MQQYEKPFRSPELIGFTQGKINISRTMMRLQGIEAEKDKTRIEKRGVKEEMSGCNESVEKMFQWMNVIESLSV